MGVALFLSFIIFITVIIAIGTTSSHKKLMSARHKPVKVVDPSFRFA